MDVCTKAIYNILTYYDVWTFETVIITYLSQYNYRDLITIF